MSLACPFGFACPYDSNCPACGAPVGPQAESTAEEPCPYSVVIIRPPGNWMPASELDAPQKGLVIDLVDHQLTDPATFVRQHNAASLDEGGAKWAALTRADPKIGAQLDLLNLRSD